MNASTQSVQNKSARPWSVYSNPHFGVGVTSVQNPGRSRRQAALGYCRPVCREQQRQDACRLEVHERVKGLEVTRHIGQVTCRANRQGFDLSHATRPHAEPVELVCVHLVAVRSLLRHGRRPASFAARRVQPLATRLEKQFDVHGYRVNSTPYKHGYRVWGVPISTATVSIWPLFTPALYTATVHYIYKPSIGAESKADVKAVKRGVWVRAVAKADLARAPPNHFCLTKP